MTYNTEVKHGIKQVALNNTFIPSSDSSSTVEVTVARFRGWVF